MPYCPNCGNKIDEKMAFCPKCGSPLKVKQPPAEAERIPAPARAEKAEKHEKGEKEEKGEKREKTEKYEKREFGFIGPLIVGLVLIFFGLMSYLQLTGFIGWEIAGALFLFMIGIIIIIGAIIASMRHPKT